ncbi:hypothetical protein Tco_0571065 [Tanacetum coccineum]
MIDQGVDAAFATRDANRSTNGEDSHNSGTGTEGVVKLTQWFERMETVFRISNCTETVGHDVAYAMTWTDLKKKMTDKYCPRSEIKKLRGTAIVCVRMLSEESVKIENMSVVSRHDPRKCYGIKAETMQDAIEMALN